MFDSESFRPSYSRAFVKRMQEKRLAEAEDARIEMLKAEAGNAQREALATKALKRELEGEERKLMQRQALASASTDFQRIFARAMVIFDVTRAELRGSNRSEMVVLARHFVMYWTRRRTGMSFPQIGKLLGGRDHTTCLHGYRTYVEKRAKMGRHLRAAR